MKLFEWEYKKINSEQIAIDWNLHQHPDIKRVDKIIKNFNPLLVNPVKVSYRDGKYWIFDGIYTFFALKKMNSGKETMIDCKVYYGMSKEDELYLRFAGHQDYTKPVSKIVREQVTNRFEKKG